MKEWGLGDERRDEWKGGGRGKKEGKGEEREG